MTIEYVDLRGIGNRIAAVLSEINAEIAAILSIDVAHASVIHSSAYADSRPQWNYRFVDATPAEAGINDEAQSYTAVITLKLGNITKGSKGVLEEQIAVWVPFTLAYIRGTVLLQSAAYPAEPDDLEETFVTLAQMGLMDDDEIGAEFRLTLPFRIQVEQRYGA